MELIGFIGIVVVAVAVGLAVQFLAKGGNSYEWLVVAIAGTFGAFFASENFPGSTVFSGITNWGAEIAGVAIIPAIIFGLVLAIVADLGMRTLPQGQGQTT